MLFAIWIRTHLKESPVFESRADVTDEGVALSRAELEAAAAQEKEASVLEAALKQRKGKAFFIALGLRFGQAGNSGLIQTFLVGYLATTLLLDRSIATNAILISSVVGFATVPLVGLLGDRFGRRPVYMALTAISAVLAFPLINLIQQGNTVALTISMILLHNLAVLGLFSLESVTMAELFGARTRFTQLALSKEIGGILATAIGPVVAAGLTAVTGSWWPIAAMLVVYSLITLVSAAVSPEVRGRDLVRLEDAA
jgi:MHS family metabolite:H+ symporter-like MFS transporter